MGEQILRKACGQCREWNQMFETAYTMNVNVSAHQFASPHLLTQILSALYVTGLEPKLLKLEITESVLISGYSGVEEVLKKAEKLGIQIYLDDFGTGYSSLSHLLNYPFDVVKIDQRFVRHLDLYPNARMWCERWGSWRRIWRNIWLRKVWNEQRRWPA